MSHKKSTRNVPVLLSINCHGYICLVLIQLIFVSSYCCFSSALFEFATRSFGPVDVFVNSAGTLNEFDWKTTVDVNYVSAKVFHLLLLLVYLVSSVN